MRRVTCKDCRRVYDYDKNEFCPRCGSHNAPNSGGSTRLEQELLERFDTARTDLRQGRGQYTVRTGGSGRYPTTTQQRQTSTAYYYTCPAEERQRSGAKAVLIILAVVAAVWLVVWLVGGILALLESGNVGLPVGGSNGGTNIVDQGEEFPYYDMTCTVEDTLWIPQSLVSTRQDGGEEQAYYLAVDVWIEGGGDYIRGRQYGEPILRGDGVETTALVDRELASQLKEYGIYMVEPRDTIWEAPLFGQLLFPVPDSEEWRGELELELPVLDRDGKCVERTVIRLEVPPMPDGEE